VNQETKEEVAQLLVQMIAEKRPRALPEAIEALGRILNRAPLNAGPDSLVRPQTVVHAFERLRKLDWTEAPFDGLNEAFSRGCRVIGLREHEIDDELRTEIIGKLEKSNASEKQLQVVREYVEIEME